MTSILSSRTVASQRAWSRSLLPPPVRLHDEEGHYIGQEVHDVFSARRGTSDEILIDDKWMLNPEPPSDKFVHHQDSGQRQLPETAYDSVRIKGKRDIHGSPLVAHVIQQSREEL